MIPKKCDGSFLHLWLFRPSSEAAIATTVSALSSLSAEEQQRAKRYRSQDRRLEFIRSRLGIRQILSSYLQMSPAAVPLTALRTGRPVVTDASGNEMLSLSISHTADLVALAVTPFAFAVGIDIEHEQHLVNQAAVLRTAFSSEEDEILDGADSKLRQRLILQCWTAKEAVLKATQLEMLPSPTDVRLVRRDGLLQIRSAPIQHELSCLTQFSVLPFHTNCESVDQIMSPQICGSVVQTPRSTLASGIAGISTTGFDQVQQSCHEVVADMVAAKLKCTLSISANGRMSSIS